MLLFKVTYSYKPKTSLILRQAKKTSKIAKKKKSGKAYTAILKSLKKQPNQYKKE